MKTPVGQVNRGTALRRLWRSATAWLLPARCAVCDERCDEVTPVCAGCRADLILNTPCCPLCAEPLVQSEPACGRCLRRAPPFQRSLVPFRYAWPLDGVVTRLKFGGDLAAGRALGRLFVEHVHGARIERPQLLVPVPLHRHRLRQRGFDQALELAHQLGRDLDVPLARSLLRRVRATTAQTALNAAGRRRNVRAAFQIDTRSLQRLGTERPHVALVDDVMTTGSTLAECARVLAAAGFTRIDAWAIARAPARV